MELIEKYLIKIFESTKRRSISAISRQAKIQRATGSIATSIARSKNDPIYKKMLFHKHKWQEYKKQLMKKYSNIAKPKARR